MGRTRALTMYLVVPCLLCAATFMIVITQFSAVVETSTLRRSHMVFVAIIAVVLLVKRDELSTER